MDEPDFKKARRQKSNLKDPLKEDRPIPHSVEAEQGVIGCILVGFTQIPVIDCLSPCIEKLASSEVFYDLRHRQIYECLLAMRADGIPIDLIILQQELKDLCQLEGVGGLAYLSSLPDSVPSAANLDYYIQILLEKHTLRRTIALATEVVSRAYDHQGEVDELVDQLAQDIFKLSQSASQTPTLHTAKELVIGSVDRFEKSFLNKGQLSGLATGFADLDKITNGLQPSEMIVIAARPSQGKSSYAMNIADHVAVELGIPVLVFSLEMTADSLMDRAICSRARVGLGSVRNGDLLVSDFSRITTAATQLRKAPLFIDDACGTGINQLRAKAKRYHEQYGIKLLVLDYLQLITSKGAENRRQEIAQVSNGIKSLAKELKIPTIAVAQLNREIEKGKKRKPMMSDIRDAGEIEQDADLIGFLYQPEREDDSPMDNDAIPVNLLIAKQRNGRTGDLPFTFLRSYTRFESASKIDSDEYVKPYND